VTNTDMQGEHSGSTVALHEPGATSTGHENIRRRMVEDDAISADSSAPAAKEAMPEITFSRSMTFHLTGHEAFVFHVASAHTDGDAVIFFRGADVIHAGDVFFNAIFPFIDLDSGGSVAGYIEAMDDILSLSDPDTRIIPGHGSLDDWTGLQAAREMPAEHRSAVKALRDDGTTEREIVGPNHLADYATM